MKNNLGIVSVGLISISLCACMGINDRSDGEFANYSGSYFNESQGFANGNYRMTPYRYEYYQPRIEQQNVTVPDSYHVGSYRSPVSFKDRDREWASGQNPNKYTIEVADDQKAASVAQKLYKMPKSDRSGQVQYTRDGKMYYKGLYGSYDNAEAAQKALDALPADMKQGAGIKSWGTVQNNLGQ